MAPDRKAHLFLIGQFLVNQASSSQHPSAQSRLLSSAHRHLKIHANEIKPILQLESI